MPKKDDDNPLEEMQKQLRDFKINVQVAFAPFMQSMTGNDDTQKKEEDGGDNSSRRNIDSRDEKLDNIRFNRRPKEIRDYLDRFVIKQEQAKRVLSVAVCDRTNHIRTCLNDSSKSPYVKPNVPPRSNGRGKTFFDEKCGTTDWSSICEGRCPTIFWETDRRV